MCPDHDHCTWALCGYEPAAGLVLLLRPMGSGRPHGSVMHESGRSMWHMRCLGIIQTQQMSKKVCPDHDHCLSGCEPAPGLVLLLHPMGSGRPHGSVMHESGRSMWHMRCLGIIQIQQMSKKVCPDHDHCTWAVSCQQSLYLALCCCCAPWAQVGHMRV